MTIQEIKQEIKSLKAEQKVKTPNTVRYQVIKEKRQQRINELMAFFNKENISWKTQA